MTDSARAVVYVRCATDESAAHSHWTQTDRCWKHARAERLTVVGHYADVGSGMRVQPSLERLVSDAERAVPGFGTVIIADLLRLGRDPAVVWDIADRLRHAEVTIDVLGLRATPGLLDLSWPCGLPLGARRPAR